MSEINLPVEKTMIITHAFCPDATYATYLMTKLIKIDKIFAIVHGEYDELVKVLRECSQTITNYIFLDIYPKQMMIDAIKDTVESITIIDHHLSENIDIDNGINNVVLNLIWNTKKCAAQLVNDMLPEEKRNPQWIIDAIAARDLNNYQLENFELSSGLYTKMILIPKNIIYNPNDNDSNDNDNFKKIISRFDYCQSYEFYEEVKTIGKEHFSKDLIECDKILSEPNNFKPHYFKNTDIKFILGWDTYQNAYKYRTLVANILFDRQDTYDIVLFMKNSADNKEIYVSGRARKGSNPDLPAIFKKYDPTAGGHSEAAGMTIPKELYDSIIDQCNAKY